METKLRPYATIIAIAVEGIGAHIVAERWFGARWRMRRVDNGWR